MTSTPAADHSDEDDLEPRHLIELSHTVLRAGILMLSAGTSGLRVREVMRATAHATGIETLKAQVTYTDIVLTVSRRGIFRTQIGEVPAPGVNAHRIAMMQGLSHELRSAPPASLDPGELAGRLRTIERTPALYPMWVLVVLVAMACASVAVLSNGGPREVAAVLPSSALAFWLLRTMASHQVNHLATVLISAMVASALYSGFTEAITLIVGEPSPRTAAGFICASIFLIPGFPLVTAGLDLTRIDLEAGIPRLGYAAMVLLSITIGVWVVASLWGLSPDPVPAFTGPPLLNWTALVLASFFAVFGWATMFNSPLKAAWLSGVVAMIGNVPRLVMLDMGVKAHVATFASCFLIGLGCAVAARVFNTTKIIMTVPTVLVSIPGSSALRTLLYVDRSDLMAAAASGVSTILVVIAMVAGLSGARMLTDPEWAFTRPDPPTLELSMVRRLLRFRRGTGETTATEVQES